MIGVKWIVRGALLRFLPTGTFLMAVGLVPLIASRVPGLSPRAPLILLGEMLAAAAGYGLTLFAMRRKLKADAPVDGRQSIVAGVVAPMAIMLSLMSLPHRLFPGQTFALSAVAGAVLGLAMFFPWLSSAPPLGTRRVEAGDSEPAELPAPPFSPPTKTYASGYTPRDKRDDGA